MTEKLLGAALLGSLALSWGCAGAPVNKSAVGKVKKVAVFAYTTYDNGDPAMHEPKSGAKKTLGKIFGRRGELQMLSAEPMAQAFAESFEKGMDWDVVPLSEVKENKGYAKLHRLYSIARVKRMAGEDALFKKAGRNDYVDGLLSWDEVDKLKPAERSALIKALGVDAAVRVKVGVRMVRKRTINILDKLALGARDVRVRVSVELCDPDSEQPIWKDAANGKGPWTADVEGLSGAKNVQKSVVEGIKLAVAKLFENYESK